MILTYILVMILSADPYPTFAFVFEFNTLKECDDAINKTKVDAEVKSKLGCIAIAREAV